MKRLTQTNTEKGNCWQTAIACLLDVDPETLPPQSELDHYTGEEKQAGMDGWYSYTNILNGYLDVHHKKRYFELPAWEAEGLGLDQTHDCILCGPTIRTSESYRIHHCVVKPHGQEIWDVHPSRAGLTAVERYGFIVPNIRRDEEQLKWEARMREGSPGYQIVFGCLCPEHGLSTVRQRIKDFRTKTAIANEVG